MQVLESLDMAQHSLGYLAVLVAKLGQVLSDYLKCHIMFFTRGGPQLVKKMPKWTYGPNIFSITAPNLKKMIRSPPNLKI